jgi:hypothetical protein
MRRRFPRNGAHSCSAKGVGTPSTGMALAGISSTIWSQLGGMEPQVGLERTPRRNPRARCGVIWERPRREEPPNPVGAHPRGAAPRFEGRPAKRPPRRIGVPAPETASGNPPSRVPTRGSIDWGTRGPGKLHRAIPPGPPPRVPRGCPRVVPVGGTLGGHSLRGTNPDRRDG